MAARLLRVSPASKWTKPLPSANVRKWSIPVVAAFAFAVAVSRCVATAPVEACVDQIEATNNAAGVRTDYAGAYRTCRR